MNNKIIKMISPEPQAIEMRAIKEAMYLQDKGADIEVIFWDRSQDKEEPEMVNIEGIKCTTFYIKSQMGTFLKQLGAMKEYKRRCKAYLRGKKVDFLHCQNLQGMMVGVYAKPNKDTKLVFDMREKYEVMTPTYRKIRYLIRAQVNRLLKKCYASVCVNEQLRKDTPKKLRSKVFVLPNYPLAKQFQDAVKSKSDFLRINYIGVVRGQTELFKMLFEACKDMPQVRINVHGTGMDYEELLKISEKYPNTNITGAYNAMNDSARLYSETDVLLCAYPPEGQIMERGGMPIKFMEAIITGTPILIPKYMWLSEIVQRDGLGYIIQEYSIQSIRQAIEKIIADRENLYQIAANIEKVKSQYCWETAVTILDKIYFAV
ncbi:MAG: glycosyltransferase family 4 protein [Christensenellaceae bacterium]